MNPANITRDEALTRSTIVATASYQVTVDLAGRDLAGAALAEPEETFLSTSTVRFSSTGEPTWIDLIAARVLTATLDGQALDPDLFADSRFPIEAAAGDHELTITALCRYSHTGEGLHRFVDPADDRIYLYTQFETADARRMYACFEQPDLKATFQLTVLALVGWTVLSNSTQPTPVDTDEGTRRWEFAPTERISTYITALIAGDYHVEPGQIQTRRGLIPAALACRQSMVQYLDSERLRTTTQRGFDVFETAFGHAYPFDSYDQVFAPEYNAGAMENAGCVTIRDEYLFRTRVTSASYEARDNTILHELAHMWFGDLVTMRWWDDLWLNESFAEWASHYAQSHIVEQHGGIDPWVGFANGRKGWAYRQDQLPTTHPVAADMVDLNAVEQNFDGITYAKGASVLKQLVAYVGEDAFLAGVRAYFAEHAFSNTELTDLLGALERTSGRDLSGFTGDWLETAGVNTLTADFDVDDQGRFTRFEVVQSAIEQYPTLRTHRMAIGLYDLVDGVLTTSDSFEVDVHGDRTSIEVLVGRPRPDLIMLNDRDLSYAKVRLDDRSLTTAVENLHTLADPLGRALAWTSAWDMWRDGEMGSRAYTDLVLRGLAQETDLTAVNTRLATLQLANTGYSHPSVRAANSNHLVASLARLLKEAPAGSDHQLAFADALISAVYTLSGVELLRGWLDGEEVPEGLEIDTDRRWKIITALARIGALDPGQIDAQAAEDQTISGVEKAAGARAALADPDAKAAAWRLATADPSVPNGTHQAIVQRFWQYGQEALLADYAERYLQVAEAISNGADGWSERGHAASQAVLMWLWPEPLADQPFIDRVDQWIADTELSDSVLHTVRERRDQSLRALRAQQASLV